MPDMSASKFHEYCIATDAEMIWMETDIVKTLQKDWKAEAADLVKSSVRLVNNPLKHASGDRTLDLLEQLSEARQLDAEQARKRTEQNRTKRKKTGQT